MKVRESGMPNEKIWEDFFDVESILTELQIDSRITDLVEIGCGYGTFTIPTAKLLKGKLYAFDIDTKMIEALQEKISTTPINNITIQHKDILTHTTELPANSVDYVMLFNILHHNAPAEFLNEAYRILKPQGKIGIIHWRSDISTPRGPDLSIRPKPEQIIAWIDTEKFKIDKAPFIIKPYHYGLLVSKI